MYVHRYEPKSKYMALYPEISPYGKGLIEDAEVISRQNRFRKDEAERLSPAGNEQVRAQYQLPRMVFGRPIVFRVLVGRKHDLLVNSRPSPAASLY